MTNIRECIVIGSPPSTALPAIERYLESKGQHPEPDASVENPRIADRA